MNIFAYTALHPNYPEYISVNAGEGQVEIIVRSPRKVNGDCGDTASIKLNPKQASDFVQTLFAHLIGEAYGRQDSTR